MQKKLAISLGIFLFLIPLTVLAQTQITDCPDKCTNGTLYQKGTLDPKTKLCIYGIQTPCKYGCENTSKIPICNEFPDKPPTNATDYDETIWNMMKKLWDKEKVKSGISIQVGGTEYDVSDGYGKVFLQMLDNQKNPISNATCFSKIFYPNSSVWQNESMMTYATEGLHYSDFVIPNITGVFMVSAYCTIPISVNTTAWDNFECGGLNCGSGWVNNWSTSGACEVRSDGSPIGNYHMRCSYTGALGEGNSSRGINLSTCTAGQLSFWAKAQGLEAGDFCRYQYWNGTALAELLSITNPNDDNTYRFYSFEVCSAYGKSANSAIYFNATVNAAGDNCWIDNINFTLTSPSNLTEYQILRGSGEIHITNHIDNILGAITSVNTTANTTLLNYLITINSTTYQINQSLYSDYISLLTAIESVNNTANETLRYALEINGTLHNLSQAELSHFQQLLAMLQDINHTLNTTLEYKLDLINGTVMQINESQTAYYLSLWGAINSLEATLNASIIGVNNSLIQYLVDMNNSLTQYLVEINGTTYQINQSQFLYYTNLLQAINSVNDTQNWQYLSLLSLLNDINATGNTTLTLVASINQTLWDDIFVILKDINFTTNTTLELKLDTINVTTWDTWLLLQNLTIGNITVSANVNWTEGYITSSFLSFSDQIEGEEIEMFTETLTCLSNTTLQHLYNGTKCVLGSCHAYNETVTEMCAYGCKNNMCIPAPQFQMMAALGFAVLVIGVMYFAYRAWK